MLLIGCTGASSGRSTVPGRSFAGLSCNGLIGLAGTVLRFLLFPALGVLVLDLYGSFDGDVNCSSSSSNPSPWPRLLFFLGVVGGPAFSLSLPVVAFDVLALALTALWRFRICALPSARSFCKNPFSVVIFCFSASARSTSSLRRAASSRCSFCSS